jgi:hypothetical protein
MHSRGVEMKDNHSRSDCVEMNGMEPPVGRDFMNKEID